MTTRTRNTTVVFGHPFLLKGVDRVLPPGEYRVVTDEELLEGLSFAAYRRVSTMIFVQAQSHQASSIEMVVIDPSDLHAAQQRDSATAQSLAIAAEALSGTVPNYGPSSLQECVPVGYDNDGSNHRA